jgi:hypothetical protein
MVYMETVESRVRRPGCRIAAASTIRNILRQVTLRIMPTDNKLRESEEPVGHIIGAGTWRDLLPRWPRPVLAYGSAELYRVMLARSEFSIPCETGEDPIVGFFTTRFVAANSIREAEDKARSAVLREWKRSGWQKLAGTAPRITVEEFEVIPSRFRLRSGGGFVFFGSSGDTM